MPGTESVVSLSSMLGGAWHLVRAPRAGEQRCEALLLPPTIPALMARLKCHLPLKAFQDSSKLALTSPLPCEL